MGSIFARLFSAPTGTEEGKILQGWKAVTCEYTHTSTFRQDGREMV